MGQPEAETGRPEQEKPQVDRCAEARITQPVAPQDDSAARIKELEAENATAAARVEEREADVAALATRLEQAEEEKADADQQILLLQAQLATAQQESQSRQKKIEALELALEAHTRNVKYHSEQIRSLTGSLTRTRQKAHTLQEGLGSQKQRRKKVEKEHAALRQDADVRLTALKSQVNELKMREKLLAEENGVLKRALDKSNTKVEVLQVKLSDRKRQINDLAKKRVELEREVESSTQIGTLRARLDEERDLREA